MAVIFALLLIPVTLAVGAAVDYSYANKIKARLDAAADAAALATLSGAEMAKSATEARANALSVFGAETITLNRAAITAKDAQITDGTAGRTVVVTYKANVAAAFLGLIGLDHVAVAGSSTASSALPTYIDFYLLLDNSPSMGVGATTSDIDTMVANTSDKCAFACHDESASGADYYALAKTLGVQMRIDVMRQATQKLMDTASDTETASDQFRMAIYTFGASARNKRLTKIQQLTSNLAGAKAAAAAIDLMTVPYQNYASDTATDLGDVLKDMNTAISSPGSGTATAPQKYLFFVSDGVADRAVGSPGCTQAITNGSDPKTGQSYVRCQEPLDPAFCTAIKSRGVKIAVLYTTYLPLPTNAWYNTWIAPFNGSIATGMQSCASPGLYFEVSPTEGISDAMTALFKKVVQQARLTK